MKEFCVVCQKDKESANWKLTDKGWVCGDHFRPRRVNHYRSVRDYDPVEVFGSKARGMSPEMFKDVPLGSLDNKSLEEVQRDDGIVDS